MYVCCMPNGLAYGTLARGAGRPAGQPSCTCRMAHARLVQVQARLCMCSWCACASRSAIILMLNVAISACFPFRSNTDGNYALTSAATSHSAHGSAGGGPFCRPTAGPGPSGESSTLTSASYEHGNPSAAITACSSASPAAPPTTSCTAPSGVSQATYTSPSHGTSRLISGAWSHATPAATAHKDTEFGIRRDAGPPSGGVARPGRR